jgi:hypothetical protein
MRRHRGSPGNDPQLTGLPMRASYPNGDTSALARESADHRRGRAGFARRAVPQCRTTSASVRRERGASRGGPRRQRRAINRRSQDAGLGYCLTTTPGPRRPRRAGRPPEPNTGPRRQPGQSGPARIPASLSRSSCCSVYTRPEGASSTSGSGPQGDLSRLRYHPCMLPAPTFPALPAGGLSLVARSLVYLHSEETSGLRPPSRKT